MNPLQRAAHAGLEEVVCFLLHRGAKISAPAYYRGGRTALQAALAAGADLVQVLLHQGADASAPPAVINGLTALEAFCWDGWVTESHDGLLRQLLDAGATVNRPSGVPGAVLHCVVKNRCHGHWAMFLEP